MEQYDALVMNLIRLTGESDIACTAGDSFNLSEMGIVAYALLSSRNLRNALNIWIQYSNSLIGTPLNLLMREHGKSGWSLSMTSYAPQPALQRFYIEEFLTSGVKLFELMATQMPAIEAISFAYPEPSHKAQYKKWFRCPLTFNAPLTVFRVRSPGLDTPVSTNNEELNLVVSQHCRQVLQQLPRNGDVEPRLRSLFLTGLSQLPDVNAASSHLGVSQRTLHRRLQKHGRNFRQLKHDFRLDLAVQYLDSGHMTLKEISYVLGYSSSSAFCRAFKTWTGQTPFEYKGTARQVSS